MRCALAIGIYANYGTSNKIPISKFQPSKSWEVNEKAVNIRE